MSYIVLQIWKKKKKLVAYITTVHERKENIRTNWQTDRKNIMKETIFVSFIIFFISEKTREELGEDTNYNTERRWNPRSKNAKQNK